MSRDRTVRVRKFTVNLFGVPNQEEIEIWTEVLFKSGIAWKFSEMTKNTKNISFQLIKKVIQT